MNPDEVVILARYVRALCPQQKFDEYTADAWHDLLALYGLDEARAAVSRHIAAGNAFVSVGEIVAEIRAARNERLERHTESEPPPGDTGDHTYQAALLAERRAIADGRTEPRPVPALPPGQSSDQPKTGRARAILASVGNKIPSPREGAVNVLAIACPHCHARPGRGCTAGNGRRRLADPHFARLEDARRIAAGQPPADQQEAERELERRHAAARDRLDRLTDEDRTQLAEFQQQLRESETS